MSAAVASKAPHNKLVGLGARLGIQASAAELQASLNPADYVYAAPSEAMLQRLLKQQMDRVGAGGEQLTSPGGAPAGYGPQAALQGAAGPAAKPCFPLAASVDDLFNNNLALELDDDCLRILLGEDEDESRPCASGGSGGLPANGSGCGGSEKSTATAEGAAAGAPAGEAEAASLPFGREDDDDIAMLFGELRGSGAGSLEALDLHMLGAAHLAATDDSDSASQAGDDGEVLVAAADSGAGLKRAKQPSEAEGSPSGRGLVLSMNYEKAAESINSELLSGRKVTCSNSMDAMLPLLAPMMELPHVDTPDSPDSLASGSNAMLARLPNLSLKRQDSCSKRKRAVRQ